MLRRQIIFHPAIVPGPPGAPTGDTLETFSGRTSAAQAPSLKAEELTAVDSPFPGEGSLGSSWLLRYDKSFSPYFDGELRGVYSDAVTQWSGSIVLP
ncbi:hypothetical protein [Nonomuraea sp. NPDC001831]|uniref:hypothetical protein n=1 Tax=Nonomuraea sp. NPDC001831 TaxID=3364340 RepID=UPI0036A3FB9D